MARQIHRSFAGCQGFRTVAPSARLRSRRDSPPHPENPRRYAADHDSLDPAVATFANFRASQHGAPLIPRRPSEEQAAAAHPCAAVGGSILSVGTGARAMEAVASVKNIGDLWHRIDAFLRSRVRPETHAKFFAPLRAVALEGDRLLIAAPDRFHRDFVEDNYRGFFEEFVPGIAGFTARIVFVVDETARQVAARTQPDPGARSRPRGDPDRPPRGAAELPLHLRELRRRRVEPVRLRGDAGGGGEPGQDLEPALHPRRLGPRQDPPPARRRPRDPREGRRRARRDRVLRALHERLRRRDQEGHHRRVPPQVPRVLRLHRRRRPVPRRQGEDGGGVLPHLQRAARPPRPDRALERSAARRI